METLLSIIVPMYNVENYLIDCIGNIKIIGGCGGDGQSGNISVSGEGGTSYWGGGGRAGAGGGVSGKAYGSGGGGAYDAGYSGTSMTGGKGAAGICIIEEFA